MRCCESRCEQRPEQARPQTGKGSWVCWGLRKGWGVTANGDRISLWGDGML